MGKVLCYNGLTAIVFPIIVISLVQATRSTGSNLLKCTEQDRYSYPCPGSSFMTRKGDFLAFLYREGASLRNRMILSWVVSCFVLCSYQTLHRHSMDLAKNTPTLPGYMSCAVVEGVQHGAIDTASASFNWVVAAPLGYSTWRRGGVQNEGQYCPYLDQMLVNG